MALLAVTGRRGGATTQTGGKFPHRRFESRRTLCTARNTASDFNGGCAPRQRPGYLRVVPGITADLAGITLGL